MTHQASKAQVFHDLHQDGCFVMPNPWDAGSAKILEGLGFQALASTSAGFARSTGVDDYQLTRDTVLAHVADLCQATTLPVSADLENGFGHAPEDCYETITLGAKAGLVGGSIEDFTGEPGQLYPIEHAKERVAAAVEAARAQSFPFTLTARAENYLVSGPDLADTIARLQAYQEAGADVLYAPALKTMDEIKSVLASIDRPLNVLMGPRDELRAISDLAALGVRRISLGSTLANVATDALIKAGGELLGTGTFAFLEGMNGSQRISDLMFKR